MLSEKSTLFIKHSKMSNHINNLNEDDNALPLPEGWVQSLSKRFSKTYYYHEETKCSVWVHPALLQGDVGDVIMENKAKGKKHSRHKKSRKSSRRDRRRTGSSVENDSHSKNSRERHSDNSPSEESASRKRKISFSKSPDEFYFDMHSHCHTSPSRTRKNFSTSPEEFFSGEERLYKPSSPPPPPPPMRKGRFSKRLRKYQGSPSRGRESFPSKSPEQLLFEAQRIHNHESRKFLKDEPDSDDEKIDPKIEDVSTKTTKLKPLAPLSKHSLIPNRKRYLSEGDVDFHELEEPQEELGRKSAEDPNQDSNFKGALKASPNLKVSPNPSQSLAVSIAEVTTRTIPVPSKRLSLSTRFQNLDNDLSIVSRVGNKNQDNLNLQYSLTQKNNQQVLCPISITNISKSTEDLTPLSILAPNSTEKLKDDIVSPKTLRNQTHSLRELIARTYPVTVDSVGHVAGFQKIDNKTSLTSCKSSSVFKTLKPLKPISMNNNNIGIKEKNSPLSILAQKKSDALENDLTSAIDYEKHNELIIARNKLSHIAKFLKSQNNGLLDFQSQKSIMNGVEVD